MIRNKNYFIPLDENIKSQVILGNRKIQNVEEKGIVAIKTKDNNEKYMGQTTMPHTVHGATLPRNFCQPNFVTYMILWQISVASLLCQLVL